MSQDNNDIDNVNVVSTTNYIDIDNVFSKSKSVEMIADKLVQKFGSEISRPFYCKVAYKLSEAVIWDNFEKAQRGKNPPALFTWLCKRSGV